MEAPLPNTDVPRRIWEVPFMQYLASPRRWRLSCVLCVLYLQYASSPTWSGDFAIHIDKSRPLAAALDLLNKRHRCAVSYEDPVYGPADIEDATDRIQQDLGRQIPEWAHRVVYFPKRRPLDLDYEWEGECSREQLNGVVQRLVDVHNHGRNPGVFRIINLEERIVVIPSGVIDENDTFISSASALDVLVNLEVNNGTGIEAIEALLTEINRSATRTVGGYIPTNMFAQNRVSFEAHDVSAREVLVLILKSIELAFGDGTILSWRLNYDPNMARNFLNIRFLTPELTGPYRMPQGKLSNQGSQP